MRSEAFIMERRDGKRIHVLGDDIMVKVSSRDTDGAFTIFEAHTSPLDGPPLHCHPDQDETWQILEGEYRFVVDGREIYAGPGSTVFAPRGSVHTFQNIGTIPGRMITTVVPGGLDEFFEDLEKVVPRGAVPDLAKVAQVVEKYGLELHGPPLRVTDAATASAAD
jgi:mannose-6-phosphate isomerase-like protein (cupin superfamily)